MPMRAGAVLDGALPIIDPQSILRCRPGVELLLEEANTTRLVAGLQDGSLDVAFLRPSAAGSEVFQLRLLSEEPMMVALPLRHPFAAQQEVALATLKEDPFLLFPRAVGPTLYDSIISACRAAGFEPIIGQLAPQIASVVNLVAAELGVSIVPASMSQLQVSGVTYRPIAGQALTARLALAYWKGETSPVVRNFITRAVS
jgi:DNA-binding transcriptional LysR family regulator